MIKNLKGTIQIPMVGFGTYLINNEETRKYVLSAIRAGYRHIDTAKAYGNEEGVGLAIKNAQSELGLSREEIFVTTKLWPGNEAWGQPPKTNESTIESFNSSLDKLKLDYIDLYLIHAPFSKDYRLEQWRALSELQQLGKAKSIGVCNYNKSHIEQIKAAGLPLPDVNQIELHPWSQKNSLISYLIENEILPIAYSSLLPLSEWRAVEGEDSAKTDKMKSDGASKNSPFKIMAKKYGVSEAQVLLRWGLQKGYPIIPKSTNEDRIRQNINVFSFEIDNEDMEAIANMDRGAGLAWASGDPIQAP
jgi:2,5-diketo-D-gluconate reductase A